MKRYSSSLFLVFLLLFISAPGCQKTRNAAQPAGTYKDITVEEAAAMIQEKADNPAFVILDVRTPAEYESGHIAGALLMDYRSENFRDELQKLDKNKEYLVYCRSGNRSRKAMEIMKELGFKTVYNMLGGIRKWKETGKPLVVPEPEQQGKL